MAHLMPRTRRGDLTLLRTITMRDGDTDSSMVRAGLLRQIIDDAEKLHRLEDILPRFISLDTMRHIMAELDAPDDR